jgi:hypothetical protein
MRDPARSSDTRAFVHFPPRHSHLPLAARVAGWWGRARILLTHLALTSWTIRRGDPLPCQKEDRPTPSVTELNVVSDHLINTNRPLPIPSRPTTRAR